MFSSGNKNTTKEEENKNLKTKKFSGALQDFLNTINKNVKSTNEKEDPKKPISTAINSGNSKIQQKSKEFEKSIGVNQKERTKETKPELNALKPENMKKFEESEFTKIKTDSNDFILTMKKENDFQNRVELFNKKNENKSEVEAKILENSETLSKENPDLIIYKYPNVKEKIGQIVDELHIVDKNISDDEKISIFLNEVDKLKTTLNLPKSIKDAGVTEQAFYDKLDEMVDGRRIDYLVSYTNLLLEQRYNDRVILLLSTDEESQLIDEAGNIITLDEGFVNNIATYIEKMTDSIAQVIQKFLNGMNDFYS